MEQQDEELDIKDEVSLEEFQILEQDDKNSLSPVSLLNSKADVQSPCIRKCASCRHPINAEYVSWELMDFCNEHCVSNFQGTNFKCVNCPWFISAINFGKYYIRVKNDFRLFCTQSCLEYYKSLANICSYCQEEISNTCTLGIQWPSSSLNRVYFCSQTCSEIFSNILKNDLPRVPPNIQCSVCKRDKPITIALRHDGISSFFCTQNCLTAYSFVKLQKGAEKCVLCQNYFSPVSLDGHIVIHDNIQLTFCSLCCQNMYILLHSKVVSCTWCHNKRYKFGMIRKYSRNLFPLLDIDLCCINCLKLYEASVTDNVKRDPKTQNLHQGRSMSNEVPQGMLSTPYNVPNQNITVTMPNIPPSSNFIRVNQNLTANSCILPISNKQEFFVQPTKNMQQRNVATMCFIPKAEKSNLARPATQNKMIQTMKPKLTKTLLPVPVPIYVPSPVAMYSIPVITAVPFPVPIPVPIFVPTAQKSTAGIMREIEKIQSSIPSDPYEAEILRIADVIADKRMEQSDEDGTSDVSEVKTLHEVNETELCRNLRESSPEIEKGLSSNSYDSQTKNTSLHTTEYIIKQGRKRCLNSMLVQDAIKFDKKLSQRQNDDLQLCIKSTDKKNLNSNLAITAWEHWIRKRNKVLKKLAENAKTFKSDILQMSSDELDSALCLFIKEIRKPNKSEYAPDTVYYLCLGIQRHLSQNGRSDNIFFDKMYNHFIDDFNQIAHNFCTLYNNESHFIVTRVEEEHLWEAKQLGSHSPQVLLSTLIFFNTKYYYCSTVEQHMDISFSQILKMSKKRAKSKSLTLRFFPKKTKNKIKRVREQYENKNNQSRCPVRLYEFYLSKCPENAKAKHSLFYLQPEKYCISDSPLWYTTSPLDKKSLATIINRMKIVKEINVALTANN